MKKYRQVNEFYIEEDENMNRNNIDPDYAVRFLQNELNYLLNSFLNGGFSNTGYVFYPFVKGISKDNLIRLKRLKKIAEFLNNYGYDFSNSIKTFNNTINSRNFALMLSMLYLDFSEIKNKNVKILKKHKCKELDLNKYKKNDMYYLRPLNQIKKYADKHLKKYLSGFYLHGSLATKDYIRGWSDVDTLSIVSKYTISNYRSLLELRDKLYLMRYFFYKIDNLQHHGSIIISEYDIDNYCQLYFPVPIFKYAKSFFKDDRIVNFKVRDFYRESLQKLFWFVDYFRRLNNDNFNLDSYETKTLLHIITLFPSIYLNAKGIFVYKKFSFDIAKKDFKKEKWEVIEKVGSIRSNWKGYGNIPLINKYSINPMLYCRLNSMLMNLFKDIKKDNNINVKNLIKGVYILSEDAWDKIKKNAKKL